MKNSKLGKSFLIAVAITLMVLSDITLAQDVQSGAEPFSFSGEKFTLDFGSNLYLSQAATDSKVSDTSAGASKADEEAMIAEALANPLSYLWLMFTQNDTKWYDGDLLDELNEDTKVMNTTLIQPVLALQMTEKWKMIFRPVFQIQSFDTIDGVDIATGNVAEDTDVNFDRKSGLGDTVLWTALSNQYKPPFVWGFGPTIMLPTASDDLLGTGKYSAGPMFLAANISDKWIIGGVFQHWWSFAGDDTMTIDTNLGPASVDRSDVNLTDFQYILRYRYSQKTNIGIAPNVQYNWETDELSLPVGMGFDTLVKIGKLPVKLGAEVYYYVQQDDDFGPEWQLRLLFVPVLPAPKWSQKPLF
ncbi:MAG: hypothetical protein AB1Z20_03355 [Desulfobacterales bacterium]